MRFLGCVYRTRLLPSIRTEVNSAIFTSTTEGEGGYIFTPFCLSICLSFCLSVCQFVTCKIEDFSSILVSRFCYSVCQLPTGHNLTPIFTKLHHLGEIVCQKEEVYCFWGQKVNIGQRSTTSVGFLKSSIFIWLTWNLKRSYRTRHLFQRANCFWDQHGPKGHRPKVNN